MIRYVTGQVRAAAGAHRPVRHNGGALMLHRVAAAYPLLAGHADLMKDTCDGLSNCQFSTSSSFMPPPSITMRRPVAEEHRHPITVDDA
jgi:hypothetical protein